MGTWAKEVEGTPPSSLTTSRAVLSGLCASGCEGHPVQQVASMSVHVLGPAARALGLVVIKPVLSGPSTPRGVGSESGWVGWAKKWAVCGARLPPPPLGGEGHFLRGCGLRDGG